MGRTKVKLLFVNESLSLAGGEKSLIALLTKIDPNVYEIDLQLFKYGEPLDSYIPNHVNLLPPLAYSVYSSSSWRKNISKFISGSNWRHFINKLTYSLKLRMATFNHPQKAQLFWESTRDSFTNSEKTYDVAIAYAQGVPTFYVMDKINAIKRVAWMNVNVKFFPKNKIFNYNYYLRYDQIVVVSNFTKDHFIDLFADLADKVSILYDMIDYQSIVKMSEKSITTFDPEVFNILTVARLNDTQKGYDITLKACKILKENKVKFHWYAVGKGSYKKDMENYIREHHLADHFTFLGTTDNPYPYFRAADLYVQTSRHEGFGLSIAEARLLNIPVVTTRFDTVFMQMVNGKNGLVTDMNAEAVAEGILKIKYDKKLYNSIVNYLKQEPKENTETVKRFNEMINKLLSAS